MKFILISTTLLSFLIANFLTIDDIKIMKDSGVKIKFINEAKAHLIKNITVNDIKNIDYIDFSNKPLYFLPEWLYKLNNLTRINLSNTNITLNALKRLKELKNLDIIDLSNNNLFKKGGKIVDVVSDLNITELYISNTNGYEDNYKDIGKLKTLVKLDLSHNNISNIQPLHLEKLVNLKQLKLNNNSISGTINPQYLPYNSIVDLDLSNNKIEKLDYYQDFSALEKLNLYQPYPKVEFDEKYNNIFLFKNLKEVRVGDNVKLPKSILIRLHIINKTFGGSNGEKLFSIIETKNGYIAVGYTWSNGKGYNDGCIVKIDKSGNLIWDKTFGDSDEDDLFSIKETKDGYIAVGFTKSKGKGKEDGWIVKIDKSGNLIWDKTFGGSNDDELFSIIGTKDGYIAAGFTKSKGKGSYDGWIFNFK